MSKNTTKINYINGIRLHRAMVAGIRKVVSHQDYLNKINVFPVPDGDTGTNMAFTLTAILDASFNKVNSRVDDMLSMIADAALDGARGNSGAILAQFFQGLSDGAIGVSQFDSLSLSRAIQKGSEYARQALSEPQEGTILTVITDFSNRLNELINSGVDDFEHIFSKGVEEAERSLQNTPNLMAVLKRAGVVDAGGQGFVDFLQGIHGFIQKGSLKEFENELPELEVIEPESVSHDITDRTWQFCTECLIKGKQIDHKELRKSLMDEGGSMVIAGSKIKAKVHIHTNVPAKIFSICEKYGIVSGQKADDMFQQQESVKNSERGEIAIVTDSGADFNTEEFDVHVVPVRYSFGEKGYIDKVSQTIPEFYEELATNPSHPQTSQPAPSDFKRKYQFLTTHYKSIISIHLPNTVSGTMQSAQTAVKRLPGARVTVLDSLNISVGQGLIVAHAARMAKKGKSHDEIVAGVNHARDITKVYCCIKDLSYGVRGGRVPSSVKAIADLLHIRPILTTSSNGKLEKAGAVLGKNNLGKKMVKYLNKNHDISKPYRISVGHCNCPEEGKTLVDGLKKTFNNLVSIELLEVGGALGVHTGPGSLVVAIQEEIQIK
jgi:DegV family protein with EDD domain